MSPPKQGFKGCSTGVTHLSKARLSGLDWAREHPVSLEPNLDLLLQKVKLLDSLIKARLLIIWFPLHQGRGIFFLQRSQAAPVNPVGERKFHVCRRFSVAISIQVAEIASDLLSGSAYSASLYSLLQYLLSALQISSWLCCAIIFF